MEIKTDESGRFCLDYVPGEFRIRFRKQGFFPHEISLKLFQKAYFPLETTHLTPSPKLIDIYGKPIEGAEVSLWVDGVAYGMDDITTKEGEYFVGGVHPPGAENVKVLFRATGYPAIDKRVASNKTHEDVKVTLIKEREPDP